MKPLVPPPPLPQSLHYNPLPDHTRSYRIVKEWKPLRPAPGLPPDHTLLPDKDGTFVAQLL